MRNGMADEMRLYARPPTYFPPALLNTLHMDVQLSTTGRRLWRIIFSKRARDSFVTKAVRGGQVNIYIQPACQCLRVHDGASRVVACNNRNNYRPFFRTGAPHRHLLRIFGVRIGAHWRCVAVSLSVFNRRFTDESVINSASCLILPLIIAVAGGVIVAFEYNDDLHPACTHGTESACVQHPIPFAQTSDTHWCFASAPKTKQSRCVAASCVVVGWSASSSPLYAHL